MFRLDDEVRPKTLFIYCDASQHIVINYIYIHILWLTTIDSGQKGGERQSFQLHMFSVNRDFR